MPGDVGGCYILRSVPLPQEIRLVVSSQHSRRIFPARQDPDSAHGRQPGDPLGTWENSERAEAELVLYAVAEAVDLKEEGEEEDGKQRCQKRRKSGAGASDGRERMGRGKGSIGERDESG
eukprot:677884-Hanusia_phi.AAC.1